MDKRLAKRHKRQVARAKEKAKVSEPDVRTPEEIAAAREAGKRSDTHPWPVLHSDAEAEAIAAESAPEPAPAEPAAAELAKPEEPSHVL